MLTAGVPVALQPLDCADALMGFPKGHTRPLESRRRRVKAVAMSIAPQLAELVGHAIRNRQNVFYFRNKDVRVLPGDPQPKAAWGRRQGGVNVTFAATGVSDKVSMAAYKPLHEVLCGEVGGYVLHPTEPSPVRIERCP